MNTLRSLLTWTALALLGLVGTLAAKDPEKTSALTVHGTVSNINPSERQFTIKDGDGRLVTLQVTPQSELRINRQKASLDQFQSGFPLSVTYQVVNGQNQVVRAVANETTADDVKREIRDALRAARDYTFQHKDEYQKRLQTVMNNVDARLDELKGQARTASAEARRQLEPQIEELRKQREVLRQRMEKVKDSTPAAWEEVKTGIGAALDDLQKAFERAAEKYKK